MPTAGRPVIGDFRSTPNNPPRAASQPEVKPSPEPVAAPADQPTTPVETAEVPVEKTDGEIYLERLKTAKIELKDAMAIFDAVLSKGYYEEYVRVRDQRATFRTRMYDDHLRLQTVLELEKPQLAISQDELITRYNLAASLYEWQGKSYKHETEQDFDAVMAVIRRLPGPMYTLLARELSKFDSKIMLIFSEGATENF